MIQRVLMDGHGVVASASGSFQATGPLAAGGKPAVSVGATIGFRRTASLNLKTVSRGCTPAAMLISDTL